MKISNVESGKAAENIADKALDSRILPEVKPRRKVMKDPAARAELTPLEQGIVVAQQAMENVSDVREEIVAKLKESIQKGEYSVSGEEIADMMMRRRAADRIR
jgi:flagellar biosynthesis anti-sigma factor FlgM